MRGRYIDFLLGGACLLQLLACAGGPSGPGGDLGTGNTSTGSDGTGTVGPLGSSPGTINPGTRPTPGFTEVEMNPATSTVLPAPAAFLKSLRLNLPLDPLIQIDEVRFFVRDLNLDDAVSLGTEYPGKFLFRLVEGELVVDESLPALGRADVPEGNYEKLDFSFEVMDEDEIPPGAEDDPLIDALVGHSMVVEGKMQLTSLLGLSLIRFRFISDQTSHIQVTSVRGFDFGSDLNQLFLAFKVRTWLDLSLQGLLNTVISSLSLPNLLQLLSGLLVIDENGPQGIALMLEANIKASLRVAPSADGIFDEIDVQEDSFSEEIP